MPPTAQGERLHASLDQPGRVWIQRGAVHPNMVCDLRASQRPCLLVSCAGMRKSVTSRSAAPQCRTSCETCH